MDKRSFSDDELAAMSPVEFLPLVTDSLGFSWIRLPKRLTQLSPTRQFKLNI